MARGWESKSVESQQDDARGTRETKIPADPVDAARQAERATVMLARTRALADLQHACAAAHRAMLEQAIAELDARLEQLAGRLGSRVCGYAGGLFNRSRERRNRWTKLICQPTRRQRWVRRRFFATVRSEHLARLTITATDKSRH